MYRERVLRSYGLGNGGTYVKICFAVRESLLNDTRYLSFVVVLPLLAQLVCVSRMSWFLTLRAVKSANMNKCKIAMGSKLILCPCTTLIEVISLTSGTIHFFARYHKIREHVQNLTPGNTSFVNAEVNFISFYVKFAQLK